MTTLDLDYPAIVMYKRGSVTVEVDEDMLTTSTAAGLKNRVMCSAVIVDCNCKAAKVKDVRFVSGKGRFWGYTFLLERIIRTELVFDDDPVEMSFEDVKMKVLRDMRAAARSVVGEDYWRALMRKVGDSQNMRELIDLILRHYDSRRFYDRIKRP